MKNLKVTTKTVSGNGVIRYHFVIDGTWDGFTYRNSTSGRTWASARSAINAGKREFGIK